MGTRDDYSQVPDAPSTDARKFYESDETDLQKPSERASLANRQPQDRVSQDPDLKFRRQIRIITWVTLSAILLVVTVTCVTWVQEKMGFIATSVTEPANLVLGPVYADTNLSETGNHFKREPVSDRPIRIAHRKNSRTKMLLSPEFAGIEADLQGPNGKGDYALYHDVDHGYTLTQFLGECREREQMAILDAKVLDKLEGAVDIVRSQGMLDDTIFQVSYGATAKRLCTYEPKVRCWFLNGGGAEPGPRIDEIRLYAPYIEGVTIYAEIVEASGAKNVIDTVHQVNGRRGPMTICIFAYGDRDNVYGNDEKYAALGVDYLATDIYPDDH